MTDKHLEEVAEEEEEGMVASTIQTHMKHQKHMRMSYDYQKSDGKQSDQDISDNVESYSSNRELQSQSIGQQLIGKKNLIVENGDNKLSVKNKKHKKNKSESNTKDDLAETQDNIVITEQSLNEQSTLLPAQNNNTSNNKQIDIQNFVSTFPTDHTTSESDNHKPLPNSWQNLNINNSQKKTLQKVSSIKNNLQEDVIGEDEEEEAVPQKKFQSFYSLMKQQSKGIDDLTPSQRRKQEPKQFITKERLQRYEQIRQLGKITELALTHVPKATKISTKNYKSLIYDYMKESKGGDDDKKPKDKKKGQFLISTEMEVKIKEHIVNNKVRANQKYQVVKNFFQIWFVNIKEMRRQEKQRSQKNSNDQMMADKIFKDTQDPKKKKFLNEKQDDHGKKVEEPEQLIIFESNYSKPGKDIRQFIPFCSDIYLGKD